MHTIFRALKVAFRLGRLDSYKIETEDFPTWDYHIMGNNLQLDGEVPLEERTEGLIAASKFYKGEYDFEGGKAMPSITDQERRI